MVSDEKYVFDLESIKDRDPEAYKALKDIENGKIAKASSAKQDPSIQKRLLKRQFLMSLCLARRDQHMTQRDLAEKTGIAQSHIARIESGKGNPSLQTLLVLMQALGAQLKVEQPKK